MAKNKKKTAYKMEDAGNVISIIKQNTTKKGKIRGKNKKQTRVLVGACVHHTYNKKGKLKPTISNDGKSTCTCRLCGGSFKGYPYSKEEVRRRINDINEVVNQAKYLAVAINAGADAIRYNSELGSMLNCFEKNYGRLGSIAEKAENSRNKKKKKRSDSDFDSIGSWSSH